MTELRRERGQQICTMQQKVYDFRHKGCCCWHKYSLNTVKLDFSDRQDKRKLGFKRQITTDQLHIYVLNHRQNKNKLDFKNQKLG